MIALIVVVFALAVACFIAGANSSAAPAANAVLSRRTGWLVHGVVLVVLGLYLVKTTTEATVGGAGTTGPDATAVDGVRVSATVSGGRC